MTGDTEKAVEEASGRRATRIASWVVEALWWLGVLVGVGLAASWRYGVELQREHDLTV